MCIPDEDEDFDEYKLTLTLVIENDQIKEIKDISGDGGKSNSFYIKAASEGVVSQILQKNSTEGIDTVSSATCSSKAIIEACPLRVRPILMTTMTTVLALIPMAMGSGEGNEMLQPMGVVMIFGMVISTIVTLLFTPVYYSVLDSLTEMLGRPFKIRHAKRAAKLQAQIAALEAEAEDSENA